MKVNFAFTVALANVVLAGPMTHLTRRDASTDLAALTSTVKVHTANINQTLATLPAANTTGTLGNSSIALSNSSANANITAEFTLIAQAMNSTSNNLAKRMSLPLFFPRQDEDGAETVAAAPCDATCQISSYNDMGALTAELAYTMAGCIVKNAVDITSSSSVLLTVVKALGEVTTDLEDSVVGIAGVVVKNLQVALGTDIGGAMATFI